MNDFTRAGNRAGSRLLVCLGIFIGGILGAIDDWWVVILVSLIVAVICFVLFMREIARL